MINVKTINNISPACKAILDPKKYAVGEDLENPEVIFVRASSLLDYDFGDKLLCVARAGIGVNTIPLEKLAERGVVVFNTPGGNANGVKELFLMALGMACRDILGAIQWVLDFDTKERDVSVVMEKVKKQFAGPEYMGKKIGVISTTDDAGEGILEDLRDCDFLTLHVPLNDETRDMINADFIAKMKDGVRIINYARQQVVNEEAIRAALNTGKVARFVTDFPTNTLIGTKNVVMTPHLGGTTWESEENCAVMAAQEARDYIENGNINNSVNFGKAVMAPSRLARLCVFHKNIPSMIAKITGAVSGAGINIENMVNASLKGSKISYTMLELGNQPDASLTEAVRAIGGVVRVRVIDAK